MTLLFRIAFWTALIFALTVAVLPMPPVPSLPSDKVQHVLAFLALTALAVAGYPRLSLPRIGLALAAFGILIELVQTIPALSRSGDPLDWVADIIGIGIVLAVAWLVRRRIGS